MKVTREKVKVSITPGDILHAVPGDSECCPVAKALNRTLGGSWQVYPAEDFWMGSDNSFTGTKVCEIPKPLATDIERFDKGRRMSVGCFEIEVETVK